MLHSVASPVSSPKPGVKICDAEVIDDTNVYTKQHVSITTPVSPGAADISGAAARNPPAPGECCDPGAVNAVAGLPAPHRERIGQTFAGRAGAERFSRVLKALGPGVNAGRGPPAPTELAKPRSGRLCLADAAAGRADCCRGRPVCARRCNRRRGRCSAPKEPKTKTHADRLRTGRINEVTERIVNAIQPISPYSATVSPASRTVKSAPGINERSI